MSWFDAGGLSTFARSALKEAQRTIDKALDIQDPQVQTKSTDLKQESESFFAEFNVIGKKGQEKKQDDTLQAPKGAKDNNDKNLLSSNIWGSFSGSFFENVSSANENSEGNKETSIVASQPQVTSSSVVQSSSPTTDSMALQKEKEVSFSSIFTSAPGLLSSFGDPLAKEDEAISTSGWGWDTQEMGASASEMLSGSGNEVKSFCESAVELVVPPPEVVSPSPEGVAPSSSDTTPPSALQPLEAKGEESTISSVSNRGRNEEVISTECNPEEGEKKAVQSSDIKLSDECPPSEVSNLDSWRPSVSEDGSRQQETDSYSKPELDASNSCTNITDFSECSSLPAPPQLELESVGENSCKSEKQQDVVQSNSVQPHDGQADAALSLLEQPSGFVSDTADPVTTSPHTSIGSLSSAPLTVQPSKSPLKLTSYPTVIDSQITRTDNSIDKWDTSIGDEIAEDDDVSLTAVEPLSTITKQPLARINENLSDTENRDVTSEDLLSCESLLSSSSTHTLQEVSPSMQSSLDSLKVDLDSSPKKSKEIEALTSVASIPALPRSREASESDSVLSATIPLDMSVESGGSSDTITASMESSQFTASCFEGLEDRCPEETELIPQLLQEAIGEDKKEVGESDTREDDTPAISVDDSSSDSKKDEGKKTNESDRENSPTSSVSLNSEIVKIGSSEHTSGHTSGDEFETTTSSDIEVISSPSLDGASAYNVPYGSSGNGTLLGPAHHTASRVWQSAHQRLKSFLVEVPGNNGKGPNGTAPQDYTISPSMTASFTSISESDGGGGSLDNWDMGGNGSSPPTSRSAKHSHYFERGHTRNQSNISETSESSGEVGSPEVDKLNKKVRELNEVVEARELRALELSQQNASLQDTIHSLQQKLSEMESSGGGGEEIMREEFTQRLAAMEKKFQQALREKETAVKSLESIRADAATRMSSSEVRLQLEERDTIISELRTEGEKLSKQQLQYSTTLKKLRAKEKENEATISNLNSKVESQSTEIERQHKQLLAKSEVERRQVSAITQLTVSLQQSEEALRTVRAEAAETEGKMTVLKEALDTAYREISEVKRQESAREAALAEHNLSAEVGARQQLQEALETARKQAEREKETLLLQIEELQEEKDRIQQHADRMDRQSRNELNLLQQQLSDSEGRGEELSSAVAAATRPLLRQLENLQSSHASHRQAWEELESQLSHRLQESEKQTAISAERERNVREQSAQAMAMKAALQTQIENIRSENASLKARVQNLTSAVSKLEEEKIKSVRDVSEIRSTMESQLNDVKSECEKLRAQIQVEKTALREEKRRSEVLQQHLNAAQAEKKTEGADGNISRQNSPTPSLSRFSVTGSVNSMMVGQWADDVFDSASTRGSNMPSLYESLRNNTATTVDALTSQLNQREGEVHHLHSELLRYEAQKESLAKELLEMTAKVTAMEAKMEELNHLKTTHEDITQKYNALLQMYGEKVEEVDELRLDLVDVKEMYKAQINQLMQQ